MKTQNTTFYQTRNGCSRCACHQSKNRFWRSRFMEPGAYKKKQDGKKTFGFISKVFKKRIISLTTTSISS